MEGTRPAGSVLSAIQSRYHLRAPDIVAHGTSWCSAAIDHRHHHGLPQGRAGTNAESHPEP